MFEILNFKGLIFLIIFFSLLFYIKKYYNTVVQKYFSIFKDYKNKKEINEILNIEDYDNYILFLIEKIKKYGIIPLNNLYFFEEKNIILINNYLKIYLLFIYKKNNKIYFEINKKEKINRNLNNINKTKNKILLDNNELIFIFENKTFYKNKNNEIFIINKIADIVEPTIFIKINNNINKIKNFEDLIEYIKIIK